MDNINREELVQELEKHLEIVSQTASVAQLKTQLKGALENVLGYTPAIQDNQPYQGMAKKADKIGLDTSATKQTVATCNICNCIYM